MPFKVFIKLLTNKLIYIVSVRVTLLKLRNGQTDTGIEFKNLLNVHIIP